MSAPSIAERVDGLAWPDLAAALDDVGAALSAPLLTDDERAELRGLYDSGSFRSTVNMRQHRYGEGEYKYFARPLPALVVELRAAFWPHLLPIARTWAERLDREAPWPDDLDDWLGRCHDGGQQRPTPLLLRYGPGGWNALHRDLYGELVFPLQVVLALDGPGVDHEGGEFVVVEQRARAQSRATTTSVGAGRALVFTTRDRPMARPAGGWSTASVRHGVSTVTTGQRTTLGLIFHDAE